MKQTLEAREAELRPGQQIEDKKQISFSALFESKMAQEPEFTGFEGRDSTIFQANDHRP